MSTSDAAIEAEIIAKGLTAPRVTPGDVAAAIASEHFFTAASGYLGNALLDHGPIALPDDYAPPPSSLNLVTICVLILQNGHRIVGVNTGPVSASNFDAELGRKLARKNAVDQIWPLLGFSLRERQTRGCRPLCEKAGVA